ncbi:MAG: extracellular solute-binding protein [Spirochaetaceae bacterium]|nr:extracellular solute-binding protein [Spirochaetaceae bacterium]
MKRLLRAATTVAAFSLLLAAALSPLGCSSAGPKKLYVFNWTYYTPDSVIEKFEKEYNVDVVYDSFDSNESMFAKLKAGGSDYDIVFPSADYVTIMAKEGMLAPIDKAKLKNLKNVDPSVLARAEEYDPGTKYSVPYYMGAAGVAVNASKVKDFEKSWSIFERSDLKDKMVMLDDMREVMGDALAYLGKSVNTVDPAEVTAAQELIDKKWKPNLLKFDAEAFAKGFASGEYWVAQGYAESIFAEYESARKSEVSFFIPKEGGPLYIDSMVILKGSKNLDLAHKFIDYIHRPEIYAEFCDAFGFPATANVPARALKKGDAWYTAQELEACELKLDLGPDLELYNSAWQTIKVGK